MEGDTLYSVKWYRNEREFFRYVPNDRPKLQIFPQDGIRVEVIKIKVFDPLILHGILVLVKESKNIFLCYFQRSKSGKHAVFLYDLQLAASGTYR